MRNSIKIFQMTLLLIICKVSFDLCEYIQLLLNAIGNNKKEKKPLNLSEMAVCNNFYILKQNTNFPNCVYFILLCIKRSIEKYFAYHNKRHRLLK